MQSVSPINLAEGLMLPVMESFYTIQGEGIQSGRAAYFIRLGGCDVGCVWCDVKASWDANAHEIFSIEKIVQNATENAGRFVVITGGEPAMYNLVPITRLLKDSGFEIAIETSGAYPISGKFDWICVSPKKFKAPILEAIVKAQELKVVIYNSSDFKWAEEQALKVNDKCELLLQPEFSKFDSIMPLIIDYVKQNPKWRISLQTHKIINVP